ncbi:MAG: glycosyltransferase family 2 protein, partial [Chloroflexota bacterium]
MKLFNYAVWRRKHIKLNLEVETASEKHPVFGILIIQGDTEGDVRVTICALRKQRYIHWTSWNTIVESSAKCNPSHLDFTETNQITSPGETLSHFIEIAKVDFFCLVEAGDTFDADYLTEMAKAAMTADSAVLYGDEDWHNPVQGRLEAPFLKPDFSPALLLSANFLRHAFYRRDVLEKVALEAKTYKELQEELAFKALELGATVKHVTGLQYHATEKTFPGQASNVERLGCINSHLKRGGLEGATAEIDVQEQVHVRWQTSGDLVSIIVPTRNQSARLTTMLDSLKAHTSYPNYEIILVDNASDEPEIARLYKRLEEKTGIRILHEQGAFNYSRSNNIGAAEAKGEILLFLNNDVEIQSEAWLTELVMWAERPEVGVVGARLMYPNGRIQHAGVVLGLVGSAGHVFIGEPPEICGPFGSPYWYRNYLAVTGACMVLRREVFDAVGGFDEAYQLTFSDISLCLKVIEKGYQVIYNPFACLIHHEGGTR